MKKSNISNKIGRPKLTREKIILEALILAEQKGLEAMSMRNLAANLKVEAMSLYKYIENKDDLIDGMIEVIYKQIPLPDSKLNWKKALKERALSERNILSKYFWIIQLLEARSGTGVTRLEHQNFLIGLLRNSGFSIELAFHTMVSITGYVYGFVIFESAWKNNSERSKTEKKAKVLITPTEHPYVIEMINYAMSRNRDKTEMHSTDFEFGLDLILNGLDKLLMEVKFA